MRRVRPGKEGAVGGEDHPETKFVGNSLEFPQIRVAQRLAHKMEVEKIRVGAQFAGEGSKFRRGHPSFLPIRSGTEVAA